MDEMGYLRKIFEQSNRNVSFNDMSKNEKKSSENSSLNVGEKIFFEDINETLIIIVPTPEQIARGKILKDEKCPCQSGKRFGKCCFYLSKNNRKKLWNNIRLKKHNINNKN